MKQRVLYLNQGDYLHILPTWDRISELLDSAPVTESRRHMVGQSAMAQYTREHAKSISARLLQECQQTNAEIRIIKGTRRVHDLCHRPGPTMRCYSAGLQQGSRLPLRVHQYVD